VAAGLTVRRAKTPRKEGESMAREFVGGTRNGTLTDAVPLPDEAVKNPGDEVKVKIPGSLASEIYALGDDGKLHYQVTLAPKKWRHSGDPCPNCGSRDNQVQATAATEQVLPTIGGPIYRYADKRLAVIDCRGCRQLVRVDLD
jgi:hypothetical protein